MEPIKKQGTFNVQGSEYILSMAATEESMIVELESKYDAQMWRNTYTKQYIEDITQKTGSFKKFAIFASMLGSAISKQSEQVSLEILTFQDIENMKQQKMQQSGQSFKSSSSSSSTVTPKSNKRYIIMAYSSEFEKVNFPLPLNYDENPDSAKLKSTILRMKDELEVAKNGKVVISADDFQNSRDSFNKSKEIKTPVDVLRNENDLLKAKLKRLEETQQQKIGAIEVDNIIREKHSLAQELESLKLHQQREQQRYQQEILDKNKELVLRNAEINAFKQELTRLIGKEAVDQKIQGYIQAMNQDEETQLSTAKKLIQKHEKTLEQLNLEFDSYKKADQRQKQRIKQLEVELETSMKKFSHKGLTDRLYSPFSNQSNGSKKSNYSAPNNRINSRVSPASSKNSFNSRNSSNSVPSVRNRSYGASPNNRAPTTFIRKPQSGTVQFQKTTPARPNPPMKVQSAQPKPVAARSPITRNPVPYNKPVNNRPSPNQKPAMTNVFPARPLNQRPSPVRNQPPPQRAPQRSSVPVQQRNNYASKPASKNEFVDHHIGTQPKGNELDNKINNLRSLLQQAKK